MRLYENELLKIHYMEVENMYQQIRGWKHDYRNHMQIMKAYATSGDTGKLLSYIDELAEDLQAVEYVIKTGNNMMDAILNSKIALAKSQNVSVSAEADISLKLNISDIDLCIIIGNLFDNAIEASLILPQNERLIRVYMDMKDTQLYISFTNFTATKKPKKVGRIFKSSKGDGHGYGLIRIDSVVEKLDGYISRNAEDGAFTTEILLPQLK